MANRTVSVALVADVGQYQSAMVRAASTTKTVGDSATAAGDKAKRGFEAAGRGATLLAGIAAGGLVLGLKSAINAASDAEQSIGGVQAVFKNYANSVIASSKEADRALGLSANSYRELATIIGSQMKNAGIPLKDLSAQTESIIGVGADLAAQFGGTTQEAVNALSSAFRGELDPIERYGISLNQAALKAKALELGLDASGPTLDQHTRLMATLALITEQSADAQGAFGRESDTAAGRAQRAAAQWENLKTAVGDRLLPAWSALVDVLGTKVIPFMGDLLDTGGDVVNFIKDNKEVALALAGVLAVQLAGGITAVNVAFNRMVLTPVVLGLTGLLGVAGNLPAAFAAARTAVAGFIATIAPLAAVGVVIYGITKFVEMANAADNARKEIAGMWEAVDSDSRGSAQLQALGDYVDQLRGKVAQLREEMADRGFWDKVFSGPFTDRGDAAALDEYEKALKRAQDRQTEANATATLLGRTFGMNRDQVLELADKYDVDLTQGVANSYVQFQRFYNNEYGNGPLKASRDLTEALRTMGDVTATAEERVKALKDALDILGGKTVSVFEAQSALQQIVASATGAMKDLTGAVLDGNGHLNAYTESGQKAGEILIGVRDKGNELITTMIEQGSKIEEVRAADAQLRESFIKSAMQMGISRQAAEALANEILGVPTDRETRFTAATDQAAARIAALQAQIDNASRDRTASIIFRATLPDLNGSASGSGRPGLATGGHVRGAGTGTSDSIPVNLSNGEYVIKASRVRELGVGTLDAVNAGRRGFADGGLVSLLANADTSGASAGLSQTMNTLGLSVEAASRRLIAGMTSTGGPAGAGVQRWLPLVIASLNMIGQPTSLAQTVLRRMQQESGGNPRAINLTDINAQRGTPSKGLMQVIDPTFRAYAMPGHGDIWSPLDNLLASERYALARYGSLSAAYNRAGGYAAGGTTPAGDPFWVGEQGPELMWSSREKYVSSAQRSREFSGGGGGGGIDSATIAALAKAISARSTSISVTAPPNEDRLVRKLVEAQRDMEFLHG